MSAPGAPGLSLDPGRGRVSQADIADVAHALVTEQGRLDRQVTALFEGGWTGPAADAYASAWREWCTGAEDVMKALRKMSLLVGGAISVIEAADLSASVSASHLQTRLGGPA